VITMPWIRPFAGLFPALALLLVVAGCGATVTAADRATGQPAATAATAATTATTATAGDRAERPVYRVAVARFSHETCTFCPGEDPEIEDWTRSGPPLTGEELYRARRVVRVGGFVGGGARARRHPSWWG
jgi:hypothetical protein